MNQNRMHLVNKIFNNETIRTVWDENQEKYFISVVDMVRVVSDSKDGRKYWNKLKQSLKEEGNETVTNCHRLKLKAQDGKYRMTDVVDIEVVLADLGELATREIAKKKNPKGLKENILIAQRGGSIAGNTRRDLENEIGESIVTNNNSLDYKYDNEKEIELK